MEKIEFDLSNEACAEIFQILCELNKRPSEWFRQVIAAHMGTGPGTRAGAAFADRHRLDIPDELHGDLAREVLLAAHPHLDQAGNL